MILRILTITYILISILCTNGQKKQNATHTDILYCIVTTLVNNNFAMDTGIIIKNKQYFDTFFPNSRVVKNYYYLNHKEINCELNFYGFSYDSTNMDSINARHIISYQLGLPFGMSNKVRTYLECVPPHYIVHLDTIKFNNFLLIYKINAPGFDSVFINELSSTIKAAMQATECKQVGTIVGRLKNFKL